MGAFPFFVIFSTMPMWFFLLIAIGVGAYDIMIFLLWNTKYVDRGDKWENIQSH